MKLLSVVFLNLLLGGDSRQIKDIASFISGSGTVTTRTGKSANDLHGEVAIESSADGDRDGSGLDTHQEHAAHDTCTPSQCQMCLDCVGDDCERLVSITQKYQEKCDEIQDALSDYKDAHGEFTTLLAGVTFKQMLEHNTAYRNLRSAMSREERNALDVARIHWARKRRGLLKRIKYNHAAAGCISHWRYRKQTDPLKRLRVTDMPVSSCIDSYAKSVCALKCIDPRDGTLTGMSMGCMLKMQACYDSQPACLMQSVCENALVCEDWKKRNCPWGKIRPGSSLLAVFANLTAFGNRSRAEDTQSLKKSLDFRSGRDIQQDSQTKSKTAKLDGGVTGKCHG